MIFIPSDRLPFVTAKLAVTFLAAEYYLSWTSTKLYCLATDTCVSDLPGASFGRAVGKSRTGDLLTAKL